ncbi:MAG: hypothetical protein PHP54_05560 [Clostridia bacterium]|nr:hypothetical protein [Clostridia bacterium]
MNFAKGMIMGMIAGTVVGAMNKDNIMGMLKNGKYQMKKMKRKYNM